MIAVDAVVVTAMPDESAPFLDRAAFVGRSLQVGHAVHRVLSLEGHDVLLVQCGIGLVNSATAAAVAISGTSPRVLVSAGSAGGVAQEVGVGDVVVGARYVYSGGDSRVFGYALGQVPGMPAAYPGDEAMLEAAAALDGPEQRVHAGMMLSGDVFVDHTTVDHIRASFPGSLSTDMESAALAHTCHLYRVPFLAVRGISDLCGPRAGTGFLTHVDDAADRSASVVTRMLHDLGPSQDAVDRTA
ncbi:5'-methylthioadenosine/S-adenosylhomocysteine nucleosidase [Actinotalea sp. K2]|uniref:5'-methylthioadenosine/S-adenosylhomocysteine nucleosidase n=1 Tax=Actinotalea sp. K2 TaxID=2939438 RepID=UPI002017777B|nr:5'-methylthioadenosine/S-adenosylhomocysteine nucleosidase [Actinotalea sp. K2]MCL3862455.1 5'-methylthioadenosine/S-adenosylhomocysteine nucleosidase [Actinotalea sp. K2]